MGSASTISNTTQAPASGSHGPWIYKPWLDLLVGCGAWSAPLLLLAYYLAKTDSHAWSLTFYFLALFFNYPHFMATVYRAYHTREEFTKYRIFTVHVAILLGIAGILTHLWYALLPWVFTLYICWSPWHYTGQNFGLLMMFTRRSGITPTDKERGALHQAFIASYVMLMLSFHTGPSGDALILSLGLPAKLTIPVRAALGLFFIVATVWALTSMAKRSGLRTIAAPMTLALTQFFWFLLPSIVELMSGSEVPQTRYSSGILALLHSAQYLWITSYYQKREAVAAGNSRWRFSTYLLTLVAGGIALFIPGPWIVSRVFHADFAASFLTFTALVNIHHFILDGALWKLRDSRIASLLLDKREKNAAHGVARPGRVMSVAHWLAGPAANARRLRIATVILLFGWAAVDQAHFYFSSEVTNVHALERAAVWNPDDSAVQMRLARAEGVAGESHAALESLERAAAVSPGNLSVQETYARGLVEAGRYTEAYAQFQKILELKPRNADAWVDIGLVAHHLGHDEEVVDDWQRAVDADPGQAHAQLYLAQALEQRGETQPAARHYRAFLEIVAADAQGHKEDANSVLTVLIKVADVDSSSNREDDAMKGYLAAVAYSEKAGNKSVESLALAHLADLQERLNRAADAAKSYQRALQLDADLSDPRSAAADWFNYGQFLLHEKQPERLALACFLQAEELLKGTSGDELAEVKKAREKSEQRLGKNAAGIRKDAASIAREALALPASAFENLS
ncbi:MAG TPA: tetratricopeptide repeat protein [Terriglobales bacterium]|nr:tetratricopeptide repeat protein [Terriglobales bacterium]